MTLLLWHASRIALGLNEWPAGWSPVSNALSNLFGDGATTEVLERVFVWAHVLLVLGFLAYLPHSKHLHIATAGDQRLVRPHPRARAARAAALRRSRTRRRCASAPATVADLTWKQMLDTMSCTECGRCQDVCPAYATGKELSPKLLIMGLRDQLFAEGPKLLAATARRSSRSPLVPNAVTRRRRLGLRHLRRLRARVPGGDRARRPHRRPAPPPRDGRVALPGRGRHDAARRRALLEPVGQAADRAGRLGGGPRRAGAAAGRAAARGPLLGRLRRLVRRARPRDGRARRRSCCRRPGVDFAILGPRECCTGDPARRMGNEYTFQSYAEQNVATLNEAGVTKIVASCPHCFNTLANEYPDFGGRYEVVHHTELLAAAARRGTAAAGGGNGGDHLPRLLLPGPPQRRAGGAARARLAGSASRSRWRGAASARSAAAPAAPTCGWRSAAARSTRSARARRSRPAPATLAVACPFCTVMLDDGVRQVGGEIRVADVATLLAEALESPPPVTG